MKPLKDLSFLYNSRSAQVAVIVAMILWFLGGREIAGSSILGLILVMVTSVAVSTFVVDEVLYIYDTRLEMSLRKMIVDEGLILPRSYTSARMNYRELLPSDFEFIRQLSSESEVVKFVDDIDTNMPRGASKKWVAKHMKLERTSLRCTRVLVDSSNILPIGAIVIINGHELEYWVKPEYRRKGIAFEAVMASIEIIEQEENIVLFARCHENNNVSASLLRKVGFNLSDTSSDGKLYWSYDKRE